MSDLNEWLKERRRIHNEATDGPWEQDEEDGVRGVDLYTNAEDEEFEDRWERRDADIRTWDADDATAIVDAHNMFPRALNALEAVNAQIDRMEADANTYGDGGHDLACDALFAYVMTLRQAIEGAINE